MIKEFDSKILSTKVKGQKVAFNAYSSAEAEEILGGLAESGTLKKQAADLASQRRRAPRTPASRDDLERRNTAQPAASNAHPIQPT